MPLTAGTLVTYDLTSFVSSHRGRMVTLQLFDPNADKVNCDFVSREGTTGKPTLVVAF